MKVIKNGYDLIEALESMTSEQLDNPVIYYNCTEERWSRIGMIDNGDNCGVSFLPTCLISTELSGNCVLEILKGMSAKKLEKEVVVMNDYEEWDNDVTVFFGKDGKSIDIVVDYNKMAT